MTLAIIGIVLVAALATIALLTVQSRRRTGQLKDRFGTEYDRTVTRSGDRHKAESELAAREKRVARLDIKPLTEAQRQDYIARWRIVQANFVDDPTAVVRDADDLVSKVMTSRGYPMATWDQRAADVSVDHPEVVSNYRNAHRISQAMDSGKATTEELRQAMVHYRTLFEELLAPEPAGVR